MERLHPLLMTLGLFGPLAGIPAVMYLLKLPLFRRQLFGTAFLLYIPLSLHWLFFLKRMSDVTGNSGGNPSPNPETTFWLILVAVVFCCVLAGFIAFWYALIFRIPLVIIFQNSLLRLPRCMTYCWDEEKGWVYRSDRPPPTVPEENVLVGESSLPCDKRVYDKRIIRAERRLRNLLVTGILVQIPLAFFGMAAWTSFRGVLQEADLDLVSCWLRQRDLKMAALRCSTDPLASQAFQLVLDGKRSGIRLFLGKELFEKFRTLQPPLLPFPRLREDDCEIDLWRDGFCEYAFAGGMKISCLYHGSDPKIENAPHQWILGRVLLEKGAPSDLTEAIPWLENASLQGHGLAQARLGKCYERGKGVATDTIEALAWYSVAASSSSFLDPSASKERDVLVKGMSLDQITEAGSRSADIRQKILRFHRGETVHPAEGTK